MIDKQEEFPGLQITFNTTEACNLQCKYCFEVNKQPKDLSLDSAKRFIDIILTDDDCIGVKGTKDEWMISKGLVMDFIGGDALMNPRLVDDILSYFQVKATLLGHRWCHNWRASISTNGTLLGRPEVRDFILKYKDNLSLGVSIDGCPAIHNFNRVYPDGRGSMDDILANWQWYLSVFGDSGRTTKATCNKDSIPYLLESLKYMHETMGIKYINQNFIFEDMQLSQEDVNELDRQMGLCVDYVLQHSDDLYWRMIDKDYTKALGMAEPDKNYCGSGCMPALGIDGNIYPCFRFLPHTVCGGTSPYVVGNVVDGLIHKDTFAAIRSMTRERISPDKCKSCEIESVCPYCIGGCLAEYGEPKRQTYICEVIKLQHKWAKEYWNRFEQLKRSE